MPAHQKLARCLNTNKHTMVIETRKEGLYCKAGDFYIDPVRPVARAVVTHAHSDHARSGNEMYYASPRSEALLRKRLGNQIDFYALPFGEQVRFGDAVVSLHPAGHVLGSAQVRVQAEGEVWVVSGDYKRDADPTCESFEVVPCDTFITEATFALPIYHWPSIDAVVESIHAWWMANRIRGRASVLFCYSLGKAQRVLGALQDLADRPVLLHGAVAPLTQIYREEGIQLAPTDLAVNDRTRRGQDYSQDLIIAPPGANGTPWMRRFGKCSSAFCSGWMQVRGNRRRRGHDRGFVLSDHADWEGLIRTIKETGARRILATHGQSDILVRYLRERGYEADAIRSRFDSARQEDDAESKEEGAKT
ncbi:ligase-associated DNA damage response exonuclease [Pelagicoccus sp. SDUM812002]|uniref:ligase-associated DNA damage response exonuclease n=1 Tax=Pelagicoccus sp. SDUM812002 TaxID=3041266 RepID=UPI00280F272E|nr:ligase-associated DNA damage response exonuclease [Pelagicoccus sp. SDUM812002]MDQ8187962.1 ligase-associated DNA damage response exonuclease [Pelagicoccus sp. SDUM812002]